MHVKSVSEKKVLLDQRNISLVRLQELLYMDLFRLHMFYINGGTIYTPVVVHDLSGDTWIFVLTTKDEAIQRFSKLSQQFKMKRALLFQTDHCEEFQ